MVSFFDIPISISEDLVCEFVDGIENILRDYATFVASCGMHIAIIFKLNI